LQDRGTGNSQDVGNGYEDRGMNIKLFNRKKRKRPDVEDMVWAIKMLMMSDKEIERMVKNFRDAILKFNKKKVKSYE